MAKTQGELKGRITRVVESDDGLNKVVHVTWFTRDTVDGMEREFEKLLDQIAVPRNATNDEIEQAVAGRKPAVSRMLNETNPGAVGREV